ncbi:hypothetical protein [Microbulbifer sp. THAF38]|uniref:hypothetical protein n=1 Tax=Microbulbifer sp. THAF38 TaxID=2587856 RepID=UPI001269631D|nr:hypothetical protein [Microbulbifer sp. THAF38]QFT53790.1 hypothetical protein FIU95_04275 [Microbulbifer sp. THAF38]
MKTIYLHIGHEKTGTTSIQNFLAENRSALDSEGFIYPEIGFQNEVHSSLVNSIHSLDNGRELEFAPPGYGDPDKEWGELIKLKNCDVENVILSSEHFISRLRVNGINFVKSFFEKNFQEYKIKIVVFLRRQDDCFTSRLSTLAKAGASQPYDFWLKEVLNKGVYYDYSKLLRPWVDAFGKDSIVLSPYRRDVNVVQEFCNLIGFSCDDIPSPERKNSSWDPLTTEIAFIINNLCKDMKPFEKRKRLNHVNKIILGKNINNGILSRKLISSDLARNILSVYEDSNLYISKEFCSGNDIFCAEVNNEDYYGEFGSLSHDDAIKIIFKSLL